MIIDGIHEFYHDKWLKNLKIALEDRKPDYFLIQHMEPDHSGNIIKLVNLFPNIKIISSYKSFIMMQNFFGNDFINNRIIIKEGDKINLGKHILHFIEAPMIHWPEVIMAYDEYSKTLFSCDAFGKFGANDINEPWEDEARRFYYGVLGKYDRQVQTLLNKLKNFEIKNIYPGHGPILTENINHYISLYDKWSKFIPEEDGVVIVYSSIYGHTKIAIEKLAEKLKSLNVKYVIHNISQSHWTKIISDAFKYNSLILASITIKDDIFAPMRQFLEILALFNYQKRNVGLIENGSWNPKSNKIMKSILSDCKSLKFLKNNVRINVLLDEKSNEEIKNLAQEIANIEF
jgi:flavorubredoxin